MIILQLLAHPTEDKCPFKPKVKSAQKNGEYVREKKKRESIDLRLVTLLNKGFQTPGFTTVHVRSMKTNSLILIPAASCLSGDIRSSCVLQCCHCDMRFYANARCF